MDMLVLKVREAAGQKAASPKLFDSVDYISNNSEVIFEPDKSTNVHLSLFISLT